MISVSEAKAILGRWHTNGNQQKVKLEHAVDLVLAKDIIATTDIPPFDNSAMDGYAFRFADWQGNALRIHGESAAGAPSADIVPALSAVRIFTGASLPPGTDTVVMQEKTSVSDGMLTITDTAISTGNNVRLKGSQTKTGDTALHAGHLLTAGSIGYLASIGTAEISVFLPPKVAIIVTGNEIVKPGENLDLGQVYECNSFSLAAALQKYRVDAELHFCRDEVHEISGTISKALEQCDFLFITGGVSVGDYDFVVPALEKNGVEKFFHKVKQKPAKPLYAGHKNKTMVFGLPGNPASVLTSFYVYAAPMLARFMGKTDIRFSEKAKLHSGFQRKPGLTQFLKGKYENGIVTILPGQESYRMDGFAYANCLIEIPEDVAEVAADAEVRVIHF